MLVLLAPTVTDLGLPQLLWEKALQHRVALIATSVFLVLLVVLRLVLADRKRLRFPLTMFAIYLVSVPARAVLDRLGMAYGAAHDEVTLAANICLAFGVIAVCGLFVFDVLGGRIVRVRILRDIASVAAGFISVVILLSRAHVNLLSIVTTSAVLTAVIGLALQDTLGNILSGVALQLESTMSIGDWVTVGDVTGQVSEIRWRSTSITTRNDDMVVIPNAVLAKGSFINLSRPVPWHRQWVYFRVHHRHSPNEVQRVVLEALHDIVNVKPSDPAPDCILYKMEQDHLQYAVRYRLLDLRHDDGTNSEVEKRIWFALRRARIELVYPSTNVFLTQLTEEREQLKQGNERASRVTLLKRVDLFAPLDGEHLELLARELVVANYGDGECVIRQDDPGDSLFVIHRGVVAVRVAVDGLQREVATIEAGQVFGEMSLLTGEKRHATVVARGDVECFVIHRDVFQRLLSADADHRILDAITTILNNRKRSLGGNVKDLSDESARLHAAHRQDLFDRIKTFFGLRST